MARTLQSMGVDVSRLPERPQWMNVKRYEDLSYLFHTCGYNYRKFKKKVAELNRSAACIKICQNCGKVDINVMSHWRDCNPEGEQQRREAQEVYWK